MTEMLGRKPGAIGGRKALRLAIWLILAAFALYLSAAAFAEEPVSHAGAFASPERAGPAAINWIDRDKEAIFPKPTPADAREEIMCLALNIYFEARGEPDEGKLAVGHVVMNRVASDRFPDTVCDVVRQGGDIKLHRCQFSWWCDGRSDTPRNQDEWVRSTEFALAVYWGFTKDPTHGALWYHADYVHPAWRSEFVRGPKIGRHIFYRAAADTPQLASRLFRN